MRVSIHTFGTRGDLQPYLALAVGLIAKGHDVTLAAPEMFGAMVEGRGVRFQPLPREMIDLIDSPEAKQVMQKGGMLAGFRLVPKVRPAMRRLLDAEKAAAEAADPDMIVYHPKALGSPHLAEKLGVPGVLAVPLPGFTPTRAFASPLLTTRSLGPFNRISHQFAVNGANALFSKELKTWRRDALALGRGTPRPDGTLYAYSPAVVPRPDDWGPDVAVTGYWFLDGEPGWAPHAALTAFLAGGPPPVYVGFGSIPTWSPEETMAMVVEALRKAGQRGILVRGWGGLRGESLGDDIHIVDGVPHDWLLPQVSAVVHHGGAGTTAAGLRAGRPTLICPFFGDQPFWGQRVADLGVGPDPIPQRGLTAEGLSAAITRMVSDDAMQRRAAALGATIRAEDGVGNAIRFLEGLMAGR